MNKSESKYFHTARCMDRAFLELLEHKDISYITVKEICDKAGVNRSTFYLHYETIGDLLHESVQYIDSQFDSYFSKESKLDVARIATASLEELYLITPQYLSPFLQYVKDHRRLFRTVMEKSELLGKNAYFRQMFQQVFSPIMDRYHIPESKKPFLLAFTIDGIIGIIKVWLENDCNDSLDFVLDTIVECIKQPK